MEYLEIEVYRTTPLVPDGGLVGDNRASESFRVCNFLRCSVQSPRFFLLAVSSPSNGEKSWRTVSLSTSFFSSSPLAVLSLELANNDDNDNDLV